MKPLYLVLIGAVILIVVYLIYRSNKNKQIAAQEAVANSIASQSQAGFLPAGSSSQVAQVISSIFPYFETATGLIGKKNDTTTKV